MREHERELCELCGWTVICGVCGNNTCNGGSGKSTGQHPTCDCEEAYEIFYDRERLMALPLFKV